MSAGLSTVANRARLVYVASKNKVKLNAALQAIKQAWVGVTPVVKGEASTLARVMQTATCSRGGAGPGAGAAVVAAVRAS
jgi:hypothetical protein